MQPHCLVLCWGLLPSSTLRSFLTTFRCSSQGGEHLVSMMGSRGGRQAGQCAVQTVLRASCFKVLVGGFVGGPAGGDTYSLVWRRGARSAQGDFALDAPAFLPVQHYRRDASPHDEYRDRPDQQTQLVQLQWGWGGGSEATSLKKGSKQ